MSCCAHCGRTDTIMGHLSCGMVSVGLCHAEPGVTVGAVLARRYESAQHEAPASVGEGLVSSQVLVGVVVLGPARRRERARRDRRGAGCRPPSTLRTP
jgi:hypothetical protein